MFEKLLLAVTMTFCLNLFLGFGLPATDKTTNRAYLAELPTTSDALIFRRTS